MGKPSKPEEDKSERPAMAKNTCGICEHWVRFPDVQQTAGEDIVGSCCLYPPRVLGIEEDGLIVQSRPITVFRDRCGQYHPRMH